MDGHLTNKEKSSWKKQTEDRIKVSNISGKRTGEKESNRAAAVRWGCGEQNKTRGRGRRGETNGAGGELLQGKGL